MKYFHQRWRLPASLLARKPWDLPGRTRYQKHTPQSLGTKTYPRHRTTRTHAHTYTHLHTQICIYTHYYYYYYYYYHHHIIIIIMDMFIISMTTIISLLLIIMSSVIIIIHYHVISFFLYLFQPNSIDPPRVWSCWLPPVAAPAAPASTSWHGRRPPRAPAKFAGEIQRLTVENGWTWTIWIHLWTYKWAIYGWSMMMYSNQNINHFFTWWSSICWIISW